MDNKKKKRKECELDSPIKEVMKLVLSNLEKRTSQIKYYGDFLDLGNEIGFCVGTSIDNMSDREISDFITGLKHGISMTNGTH